MTAPADLSDRHDRPSWQIRLLQQIQDLAAHRTAVARNGSEAIAGTEQQTLHTWRTQLPRLEQLRIDLEARPTATGGPRPWIDTVLVHRHRGARYTDTYPAAPPGAPTPRDESTDGLAVDVWQLQHMAAPAAARRERRYRQASSPNRSAHRRAVQPQHDGAVAATDVASVAPHHTVPSRGHQAGTGL